MTTEYTCARAKKSIIALWLVFRSSKSNGINGCENWYGNQENTEAYLRKSKKRDFYAFVLTVN